MTALAISSLSLLPKRTEIAPQVLPVSRLGEVAKDTFSRAQHDPVAPMNTLRDHFKSFNFALGTAFQTIKVLKMPYVYLDYFIHGIKDDTVPGIISNVLYLFSEIGSFFQWLGKMMVINLAKIAKALGKIKFIGAFFKIPLTHFINFFCGFSYFFYGVDAIVKLAKGNLQGKEKAIAWLNLISSVIQVAFMILFFAGGVTAPIAIFVNVATYGLWGITLLIRYGDKLCCKKKAKPTPPPQPQPNRGIAEQVREEQLREQQRRLSAL